MADAREYYNEDISRRAFLTTTATAAAGVAGAVAAGPAGAELQPPAQKALSDPAVTHEKVTFKSGADTINGFLARPKAATKSPGVLIVPGIFGVSEYMEESAAQLAQNGFAALAVNIFSRTPEASGEQDFQKLRPIVDKMTDAQILGDCQAGVDYLKSQPFVKPGGVGVVGFCMGGRYCILLAAQSKDVAAAAPYYGPLVMTGGQKTPARPASAMDVVGKIKVPVQGHYGSSDAGIPIDDVQKFEAALKQKGGTVEMFIYELAPHAFHDYSRPSYRPDAARLAWSRTIAFFKKHLGT